MGLCKRLSWPEEFKTMSAINLNHSAKQCIQSSEPITWKPVKQTNQPQMNADERRCLLAADRGKLLYLRLSAFICG